MLLICLAFWNFLRGEPKVGFGGREDWYRLIEGFAVPLIIIGAIGIPAMIATLIAIMNTWVTAKAHIRIVTLNRLLVLLWFCPQLKRAMPSFTLI